MIGLVVNPASSKDIRRLVALGRVVTVEEKANLVARFLAGAVGGGGEVLALDDSAGITRRARRAAAADVALSWLPVTAAGTEDDSIAAAEQLRDAGVDLVVVVGGDGTLRAVAQGWPTAPVLLLPAGTNNAFASPIEPTVAGLAAAHAGSPDVRREAFEPRLRFEVEADQEATTAVVDVVGVRDPWLASRAIWRPEHLVEAVVSRCDPSTIGMAAVAASFGPLAPGAVRHLRFGEGGHRVTAAFGPGLVVEVAVSEVRDLGPDGVVRLRPETGVVALDGERRVLHGASGRVAVRPGPHAFDPGRALALVNRGVAAGFVGVAANRPPTP